MVRERQTPGKPRRQSIDTKYSINLRRLTEFFFKASLTLIALYFAFIKIDFMRALRLLVDSSPALPVLSFFLYNISQIISSYRLHYFFYGFRIPISAQDNLKLYYLGMFYNMFLPGGIGGDAYKVLFIGQKYHVRSAPIAKALLLDRLSGLVFIVLFGGALFPWSRFSNFPAIPFTWLIPVLALISLPAYIQLSGTLFNWKRKSTLTPLFLAALIQAIQILLVYFLAIAITPGEIPSFIDLSIIFLVSSVVSSLPVSVGGIGARELVFIYGFQSLELPPEVGIAISFSFFSITALSSLPGILTHIPTVTFRRMSI